MGNPWLINSHRAEDGTQSDLIIEEASSPPDGLLDRSAAWSAGRCPRDGPG